MSEVKGELIGIQAKSEIANKTLDELKVGQADVCERIQTAALDVRDLFAAREQRDKERADAAAAREAERQARQEDRRSAIITRLLDPQTILIAAIIAAGLLGLNVQQLTQAIAPAVSIAEKIAPDGATAPPEDAEPPE